MAAEKKVVGARLPKDKRDFEDHFSRHANVYVRFRPTYPDDLYSYLASIAPHRRLAWDCGTGNGQAAIGLADHFDRVVATDASPDQLVLAPFHSKIEYRVARSEESGLETSSAALITSAVAVHWFDFERFYNEVRRVLTPRGVIAVWCYSLPITEPEIDRILDYFCYNLLSKYWPERFRYIQEEYRTLPFPFDELKPPKFTMQTVWDMRDMVGFLQSWSGTSRYERTTGQNPVDLIRPELSKAWGAESRKRVLQWSLHIRAGGA